MRILIALLALAGGIAPLHAHTLHDEAGLPLAPSMGTSDTLRCVVGSVSSNCPPSTIVSSSPFTAPGALTARTMLSRLSDAPTVRDWGAACDGATDDSTALANAAAALRNTGRALRVPGNCRLRLAGAAQAWLKGVRLVGDGVREIGSAGPSLYGQQGSTILIASAVVSPILVSDDWAIEGLTFNWPSQTEAAAVSNGNTPLVYPPLIVPHGTDAVQSCAFSGNQVQNAYDVIDLSAASGGGHCHFDRNQMFALRYHFRLRAFGGESWFTDNQFSPIAYLYGVLGTTTTVLRDYAAANAEAFRLEGNGTTSAIETSGAVEGMRASGNYGLGLRYGMHVVGGAANLMNWTANSWDQVQTVLGVDSGGWIGASTISSGTWLCQRFNNTASTAPCVTISGGAPGSSLTISGVDVAVAVGAGVVFNDPGAGILTITGGRLANIGQISTGNPFHGVTFSAIGGSLTITGTSIYSTAAANTSGGSYALVLSGSETAVVSGVTLGGWSVPVLDSGTGRHVITGTASYGSAAPVGTNALQGLAAGRVVQAGNVWDIGPQRLAIQAPTGQSAGVRCGGVDTVVGCTIETQGAAGVTVASGVGTVAEFNPTGSGTQSSHPILASGTSGSTIAPSSGTLGVSGIPLCSAAITGQLCAASSTAGAAASVK